MKVVCVPRGQVTVAVSLSVSLSLTHAHHAQCAGSVRVGRIEYGTHEL